MADNDPNNTQGSPSTIAPCGGITKPEPTDLEKKLKDIQDKQDAIVDIQAEVKALQEKDAEIKQAADKYDAFYKVSAPKFADAKIAVNKQIDGAKGEINDPDLIDKISKNIKTEITTSDNWICLLKTELETARTGLITAQKQALDDEKTYQAAQAELDQLKNLPKITDASLSELKTLIDETEKAHDAKDYPRKYLLADISKQAIVDTTNIADPATYNTDFKQKAETVYAAKLKSEKAKKTVERQAKALTELNKAYEAALAVKQKDLLKKLKALPTA